MDRIRLGLEIWMAAALLAGCIPAETTLPTMTLTGQPASTTTRPSDTATPVIPTLTPTLHPSATSTPIFTPPSETPSDTPTPSSTDLLQTMVASYPAKISSSYPSTDQKWRVEVVVYNECTQDMSDPNSYEALKLVDLTSGAETLIEDQLLYCGGIGAGGLAGLFWSPNSRYFYYSDAAFGRPDGGCFGWQTPISRLDVTTHMTEGRTGQISPDHTTITAWSEKDIVIWQVNSDKAAHVPAAGSAGAIIALAWEPDRQSFVYLQMDYDPANACMPVGNTSVVRVDLPDFRQTVLFTADAPGYDGVSWDAQNSIRLSTLQGEIWSYNFVTKELTQP